MHKLDSTKKKSILDDLAQLPDSELTEFLSKKAGFTVDQLMKLAADAVQLRTARAASSQEAQPKIIPLRAIGPYLKEGTKKISIMEKCSARTPVAQIKLALVSCKSVAQRAICVIVSPCLLIAARALLSCYCRQPQVWASIKVFDVEGATDFPEPTQADINGENGDSVYNSTVVPGKKDLASRMRIQYKEKLTAMFLPYRGKAPYPGDGANSQVNVTVGGTAKTFLFPLVDLGKGDWKTTPIELLSHAQAQIYFTVCVHDKLC